MTAPPPFAVGFGYDVHQLERGRPLFLGGVRIEFDRGLVGHSDADVLLHAICDALLGAAGLRDIGFYFPNNDPRWAGADSRTFLGAVAERLRDSGWLVGNIDCTIITEAPRISPFIQDMKERIAQDVGIEATRVGVKATTNEQMGFIGREEGIAAMAVAMIYRKSEG